MNKKTAAGEICFDQFKARPVEEKDLAVMLERRNQPQMKAVMFSGHDITREEHTAWFDRINKLETKLHFIMEYNDTAAGYFGFNKVDFTSGVCYTGSYGLNLDRLKIPFRGILLGEFAIEYAFSVLGMNKVCAQVLVKANAAAGRINELYFGYHEEGVLKEHVLKNNVPDDILLQALFRHEWQERRKQFIINN